VPRAPKDVFMPVRSPVHGAAGAPAIPLPSFRGGLLVLSGPALEGKGPLAALLAELLPDAVHLGGRDDLGKALDERVLLGDAARAWQSRKRLAPTLIVSARFGTPAARRRAAALAESEHMPFLLVECTSSSIRSLRKVSRLFLPPEETARRIERYEQARASYVALDAEEKKALGARSLKRVLDDLDRAAAKVTEAWSRA